MYKQIHTSCANETTRSYAVRWKENRTAETLSWSLSASFSIFM